MIISAFLAEAFYSATFSSPFNWAGLISILSVDSILEESSRFKVRNKFEVFRVKQSKNRTKRAVKSTSVLDSLS